MVVQIAWVAHIIHNIVWLYTVCSSCAVKQHVFPLQVRESYRSYEVTPERSVNGLAESGEPVTEQPKV